MIAHVSLPNVTGNDLPATLSHDVVTGLLREHLGFEGLIVTDSMQMKTVSARLSAGPAAVQSIQAGVDLILMPANLSGAVDGVINAVEEGELSEERIDESVLRILVAKLKYGIIASPGEEAVAEEGADQQ